MSDSSNVKPERSDRFPGISYTDMLEADTRPAPDYLLMESNIDMDDEPLSTDRYTCSEFKAREDELLWPNIWQFAAREEDMPEPGDNVVYEINDRSFVLVRQKDNSIRAFHNVCLHRGRKLRTVSGSATQMRCPFHGFTWNNDGTLKEIPCQWDFTHLQNKDLSLPELRVEQWQGFIMITENDEIPPFTEWIGPGIEHYDNWNLGECYTGAWVGRVVPANWKVAAEAFMEAWHSVVTHPQILPFTADMNSRYDLYGDHMNRAITPTGASSPYIQGKDQIYVIEKLGEFLSGDSRGRSDETSVNDLKGFDENDPALARKVLAEANREAFQEMNGHDYSKATDSEMLDNFTYNIFPNFSPWGGLIPNIVYRWRPWKDTDHCLMEVRVLMRTPQGEKPPKCEGMRLIPDDKPWTSAGDLIGDELANVFDQDMKNLPHVQQGMKASKNKKLELAHYQESRIRHFHQTLDKYLNGDLPAKKA